MSKRLKSFKFLGKLPVPKSREGNPTCDEEAFENAIPLYNEALRKSGYSGDLLYQEQNQTHPRNRTRKRNIVWFNPPYSESPKTNIGKELFRLFEKHFPAHHRLHKICNKNNVKLSYSCLPNIASKISAHNKKLLNTTEDSNAPIDNTCKCRDKAKCPIPGKCRESSIIHHDTAEGNGEVLHYYGCLKNEFKTRYCNHVHSFKHHSKRKATEPSKFTWA